MTDYAELRAALDALSAETEGRGIPWFDREQDLREVATGEFEPEFSRLPETDMNYIAAANPEAIRALLAERDAMKANLEVALEWHESQDKAISKQPNANTGHNGWMRAEHQEQAAVIRAALAQGKS